MPHAVEMPSFLADDTGPMLSSNNHQYDAPSHLQQSHEKVNGNTRSYSHTSTKGSVVDGPEGYMDGGRVQMNGDTLHDGGLNSLPNGRTSGSTWDQRSSQNGSTLSVNGGINGRPNWPFSSPDLAELRLTKSPQLRLFRTTSSP